METYFTADPHFGHRRIIELCDRPFSDVDHMNAQMVENFNEVAAGQRLVILGDICLGKLDESLSWLALLEVAELVLVPGNHDRWSLAYHQKGDAEAQMRRRLEAMEKYQVNDRVRILGDQTPSAFNWFDLTGEEAPEELGRALFSHYPYDGDSQGENRAGFLRAPDFGQPIFHGHVHEEWDVRGRQFNVGVDVRDFKPVSTEEMVAWVSSL